MQGPQHNLDDDWEGLDPTQSRTGSRTMLYAGIGIAVLFGLVVCGVAVYFVWSQFLSDPAEVASPPIVVPTSAVEETAVALTDQPDIAPTSTLPASAPTVPASSGTVTAARLTAPPTIDGVLGEWTGVAAVSSRNRVYSVAGWDGTVDCTAVWQLAWDDTNLYVAVRVTDDIHVQNASGNLIYRGDSVDMQFDTNLQGDYDNSLSPDDFQITLSPGSFAGSGPTAFRYQGTASGAILDAPGGHHVTVAAQQTSTGYTLEAAIPWSDLNLTPSAGLTIGLSLNANDNDTVGTAVQEVMMSNNPNRTLTDPTTWGTLTLE
ncbi:MAG: hypothetical protein H6657_09910 [Ardenticatenaceae bacterium]|nr:hypothetical protein [Ardenticatenaceae bacterium]